MSTLSANIQYRPIRIGWCVRDNNLEDYKKALRLTHTLWGGRYNPIIPIANFDAASELVSFFEVDVLFPISDDKCIVEFIDKFPHLPWPHHYEKSLFITWVNKKEPVFLDIFQAALRLRADLNKENALSNVAFNLIEWASNDPLSNVFSAMFGCFPAAQELDADFDYKEAIAKTLKTDNITLNPDEPVDSKLINTPVINWLTTYALNGKASTGWSTPGFYVGESNNFNDLVNFWNLRACGIELIYYDPVMKDRFSKLKEDYTQLLRSRPPFAYEQTASVGVWLQESNFNTFNQSEFDGQITVCRIGEGIWNGLNIKNPNWRFNCNRQTLLGVLSEGNHKSLAFQLPQKPACDIALVSNQYLVATVKVYGDVFSDVDTFSTPYIPQLNQFYGQNSFEREKIRVEKNGLGFIIQNRDSTIHFYAIKVKQLIEEIFRLCGMKIAASLAGIKTFRLIKQLGGLQNCRVFKVEGFRELIKTYSPMQSFTKGCATKMIYDNGSKEATSGSFKYERVYLDGKKLSPDILFSFLLRKSVFRAGLNLKCSNCELEFWRVIDDLKSNSICEYCGDEFEILSQLKDRDWFYRRSGIFGLNDNQEGGIPVSLTLQQLALHNHSEKFLYLTSVNIERETAEINKCESDFVVLTCDHDGKISIVIGECKSSGGEISQKDVENLIKVADSLSRDHIDTYILFSKLANFSDEEVNRCRLAQAKYRDRVILLTDEELESSFLWEKKKDLFQINQHATTWEGMTMNTKAIYFEKRTLSVPRDVMMIPSEI